MIIIVALMHFFRAGRYLEGNLHTLYYSYASDFLLPFSIYFLLCISERNIPNFLKWYSKALVIIGIATLAEVLQYFGIYALGKTFDPVDILMYIAGVGTAVVIERFIFPHKKI